uniref:Poly(A) polymerase n=1 Tax=Rhodosorus marinus TaxID=101924 RepID=A0A7S3E9U5_9RHOD|mmetsp:Transcript_20141/g.80983  ORF Transcript_20141/g.80983 Transcript_20141/m.80983 type:complete len:548 (+) Transcript_20141:323-1966(+)
MCVYEACDMRENFLPAETDFGDEVLSGGRVQEILGKQLEEYLGENKVHTTAYEKERRVKVLETLKAIGEDWIRGIADASGVGIHAEAIRICTFGSYHLGVDHPESDVDVLILCPKFVDRQKDIFGPLDMPGTGEHGKSGITLVEALRKHPQVDQLLAVSDAFVPVVKFVLDGIHVDLISAIIPQAEIPTEVDLLSPNSDLFLKMDSSSRQGINAMRISREILRLVPDEDAFRSTLRAVKLWARRRGIYSNILGYLGGISWTIMTAKVCTIYHPSPPAVLLYKFFQLFAMYWDWPRPVVLAELASETQSPYLREWNPDLYPSDRRHVMPIITPVHPMMNTTHNVSLSTYRVIVGELVRGYSCLLSLCAEGIEKSENCRNLWGQLFERTEFFSWYPTYLKIDVSSENTITQTRWKGLVESRLRHLLQMLQNFQFKQVHLCADENNATTSNHHSFYIGIDARNWKGSLENLQKLVTSSVNQWVSEELEWQRDHATMKITYSMSPGEVAPSRNSTGKRIKRKQRKAQRHHQAREGDTLNDREQQHITSVTT